MKKIYCFAFAIALMWSQACVQAPQTKTKPSDIRFLLEHKVRPAQISNGKSTDVGAFAWFAKQ